MCHGDVVLQVCSNTAETNIHALRDIVRHTAGLLSLRWKMDGFLPPHTIKKLGKETVRNLLGFKDGTANLDASDQALMNDIVWVGPNGGEPAWTSGGTYQAIRIIRMFVERWDRDALIEQEQIIGREKASGAPLTFAQERDVPDYAADPKGERIPLNAHIRLANPRTPATEANRLLRRGYNYSRGADEGRPTRHGASVRLLPVGPRGGLSCGPVAPQRRTARGIYQAVRRRVFLRPAGRPIEGRFLRRRSLARRGVGLPRPQRPARGLRFGHLTIRSGQNSGARSVSLADTRPRTETPASCTLSGEPDIERMPAVEVPSLGDQPVGAGDGKPAQLANRGRRQLHAVGHNPVTARIVEAAARLAVEQPAANVGEVNLGRVLVLELDEAAAAAAVA